MKRPWLTHTLASAAVLLTLVVPGPGEAAKRRDRKRPSPAATAQPASPPVPEEDTTAAPPATAPRPRPPAAERPSPTSSAGLAPGETPRLAVFGFQAQGLGPDELAAVENALSNVATRYTTMRVMAAGDLRAMVNLGSAQQLTGCADQSCLNQFGDILAAHRLLTGSIQTVGDTYQINLRLLDLVHGRVLQSTSVTSDQKLEAVIEAASGAVPALFGVVARIAVWNQPENAEVFLDGALVGPTPVATITARTPGPHTVSIDGPGITPWQTQVHIRPGEDLRIRALNESLVALETEAAAQRRFAGITGASALGGAVVSGVLLALAARSDARLRRLDRRRVTQSELDAITQTTFTLTLSSAAVGLVAAALGGTSIYALLDNPAADKLTAATGSPPAPVDP